MFHGTGLKSLDLDSLSFAEGSLLFVVVGFIDSVEPMPVFCFLSGGGASQLRCGFPPVSDVAADMKEPATFNEQSFQINGIILVTLLCFLLVEIMASRLGNAIERMGETLCRRGESIHIDIE